MLPLNKENLNRNLKSRHVQMIAIGGSIGVGLFLYSSKTIQLAGPAVLLTYVLVGLITYVIMRSLGEMAVKYPISGSFSAYANEFLSPGMGYITGWSYWFLWAFAVMAEISAAGKYMQYWFPNTPSWIWALSSLVLLTIINLTNVKIFGEVEFWFALIKVITIIALIIVGLAIIAINFFNSNFQEIGFSNLWSHGGFAPKGMEAVIFAIGPIAASFIGVESIGLTAGEAKNPEKTLPSAINKVIVRVCIFYIGSLLVIMSLFPWDQMDPERSPFVLTFDKIGLQSAAGIINFVVLTAALSACNSGIFSSSRMLHTLASQDCAPRALQKLNKKSIPVFAVLVSTFFMLMGVVLLFFFPNDAFNIVLSAAAIAGIFIWGVILITQIRFRKTLNSEEINKLKYKSVFFPYANYIGLALLALIVVMCALNDSFRAGVILFPIWVVILMITYKIQKSIKDKIHHEN